MAFSVTTTNLAPTIQDTRNFNRFSDARQEVVDARIFEGIHFRFADEAARKQGMGVAKWVFNNFLRPLNNHKDDDNGDDPDDQSETLTPITSSPAM